MRYYLVNCYVGHCGRGSSRDIAFPIAAKNLLAAQMKAKHLPAVKHHNSKYLLSAKEITREEYEERRKYNPYEKALRF